jgi:DNA-binding PadR family transcriptional regulator
MKGERLGEFEELLLLSLKALGGTYGVPIQQYMERVTRRPISMGPVYAALDRLERKGFVRSALSDPTPEPGGKRRRLYSVTAEGMRALQQARRIRDRLWKAIEQE